MEPGRNQEGLISYFPQGIPILARGKGRKALRPPKKESLGGN